MTRRFPAIVLGLLLLAGGRPAAAQDDSDLSITAGALRLTATGRVAIDARDTKGASADDDNSGFDVARRRIGVNGSLGKRLEFEVERELGGSDAWSDAYADYRVHPALRIRAGQFKLPFSLDATTSVMHLDFVNRSRAATQLAPGRDRGVMAHGKFWDKRLEYEAGLFRHDGAGPSTRHPERTYGSGTVAGRLTLRPFASSKRAGSDVRVGLAMADAHVAEGVSNLRGRTTADDTFFPAAYWVAGRRHRTGLEARWRPGPFTFTAEYMRVADERRGQGVVGDDLSPLVGTGWYAASVWRLPKAVVPWRGIRLETAARIEGLGFRSADQLGVAATNPRAERIAGGDDRAMTLGVNLWVGRHVKVLFNAIHERVHEADGVSPANSSWTRVVSFQLGL